MTQSSGKNQSEGDALPSYPLDSVAGSRLSVGDHGRVDAGETAATAQRTPRLASLLRVGLGVLPWLLALGTATVVLMAAGTPAGDIARYGAYWCFGVTLPGLLVTRAALGTRGNWPQDLAIGALTGLGLELVCFALWSAIAAARMLGASFSASVPFGAVKTRVT